MAHRIAVEPLWVSSSAKFRGLQSEFALAVRRELLRVEGPTSSPPPSDGTSQINTPPPPTPSSPSSFQSLDPNVVIILVVLLFALICAAFLNTVMRCVLRRSHNRRVEPPVIGDQSVEGLDDKTLESLPVFTFKSAEKSKETEADCTICLSEFVENEKLRLLPNCGHTFHLDCIDMWLLSHVSCPVCRDAIGDDPNAHSIIMSEDGNGIENRGRAMSTIQPMEEIPNLRVELLRDTPHSAAITVPGEESMGSSRRTLRSALFSMFNSDNTSNRFSADNTSNRFSSDQNAPRYSSDPSTSYDPPNASPRLSPPPRIESIL